MTVTINKMSAGKGYEYLLRTVAAGDGDRSLSTPLTRYYTEAGTPPGRWMGSGVASLETAIRVGDEVTEEQLKQLIGQGAHPITGEPLGRRYRTYDQPVAGKRRHAVAGYDLTFSIPKSASVLWGVADGGTQALIVEAHHAAVADALDFLEREVVATRVGDKGPKGAVAQVEVTGVVAPGSTTTTHGPTTRTCTPTSSSPTRSRPSATASGAPSTAPHCMGGSSHSPNCTRRRSATT